MKKMLGIIICTLAIFALVGCSNAGSNADGTVTTDV